MGNKPVPKKLKVYQGYDPAHVFGSSQEHDSTHQFEPWYKRWYKSLFSSSINAYALSTIKEIFFPKGSFSKNEKINPSTRGEMCHEVSHVYLDHHGRFGADLDKQEFEAEEFTVKTLYKHDPKALQAYIKNKPYLFPVSYKSPYVLGIISGLAKLPDNKETKKLINSYRKNSNKPLVRLLFGLGIINFIDLSLTLRRDKCINRKWLRNTFVSMGAALIPIGVNAYLLNRQLKNKWSNHLFALY